jgi:hypothetical protein
VRRRRAVRRGGVDLGDAIERMAQALREDATPVIPSPRDSIA